ncbi:hypothetical protein POM88_045941 [Heracleum sosnowskyi]|uniref:Reverse transcriptase zinc-binding domain-containing protein n=1 Tax=Heracleum sosnowskyi TaxID=360622 RepID=A0AAD8H8E3_9APIA|nr:hypothetical protein POM88_045941 [Heracleum sosnowskyi]
MILWEKTLRYRCAIWRVGNGHSIQVYNTNGYTSLTLSFRLPDVLPEETKLVNLRLSTGLWNQASILESFLHSEAKPILSIPWPIHDTPDKLIWNSKDSVQSGYWKALRQLGIGQATSLSGPSTWWKNIQSFNVPPKVKKFAWRASLG